MVLSTRDELASESRVPQLLIGILIPEIIATLTIIGRVYCRYFLVHFWGWDDTLVVIAWAGSAAITILFAVATLYGIGRHQITVPASNYDMALKLSYATLLIHQLTILTTKFSILVFYIRIFPTKRERNLSLGTIGVIVLFGIPLFIACVMQCGIGTHGFIFAPAMNHCVDYETFLLVSTILHVLTDLWLILLVLPIVISLQIRLRQKIIICSIFGLGFFVMTASISRLVVLKKIVRSLFQGHGDFYWDVYPYDIWTMAEVATGLVCACVPTLKPLVVKTFPWFMASRSSKDDAGYVGSRSRGRGRSGIGGIGGNGRDGAIELGRGTDVKVKRGVDGFGVGAEDGRILSSGMSVESNEWQSKDLRVVESVADTDGERGSEERIVRAA